MRFIWHNLTICNQIDSSNTLKRYMDMLSNFKILCDESKEKKIEDTRTLNFLMRVVIFFVISKC